MYLLCQSNLQFFVIFSKAPKNFIKDLNKLLNKPKKLGSLQFFNFVQKLF